MLYLLHTFANKAKSSVREQADTGLSDVFHVHRCILFELLNAQMIQQFGQLILWHRHVQMFGYFQSLAS